MKTKQEILKEFEDKFTNKDFKCVTLNNEVLLWGKVEDAKAFISLYLEEARTESPYNVSEWAMVGKKRGYWEYFKAEVISEYLLEVKNAIKIK